MSSQNSSANAQKIVPPQFIPPMSLHRFCAITGLSKVSAWRYEKRGWLRSHLIANRRYILAADVVEFNRRLASDEFAGNVSKFFAPARLDQRNQGPFAEKISDKKSILRTFCAMNYDPPGGWGSLVTGAG